MNKNKVLPLMILTGLLEKGRRLVSSVDIGTQPLTPRRESLEISKRKLNKLKGKKARKNRGKLR
jgi:hypothetical protein